MLLVVVVVAVIAAAVPRYYYDCCASIVNFTIVFVSFLLFFCMNKRLDYYFIPDDSDNFSLLCRLVDEPDGCSSSLTSSHESLFLGITTIAVHIPYKFKTHPTPHNYGHQYLIVQRFFYNCCRIFGCLSCELTSYYFRR